ncbi:lipid droplet-associated protein [Nocardia transvalensis]|uniref:lipid droplet-associated protein n=1 Tax=Nocardia transvalensis TaxID=37333 RepID=UPI00189532DF|nr:lipid droplet-associated protein [Nocardia transvalensis]MBF6330924.1 lipid droplet-associated protein [Nocardia transvalensis]
MFRPPFIARVAAGAAVYVIEETRRLPTAAMNFPITAISQLLQTTMHAQQFVTSLALKGDAVFDRLANRPVEQPEWATFDEDIAPEQTVGIGPEPVRASRFDLYSEPEPIIEPEPVAETAPEPKPAAETEAIAEPEPGTETPAAAKASTNGRSAGTVVVPEVAKRYDYANMTLAQLRARLRVLSLDDLAALLEYELQTRDRAPFVTMLTNRIATVQAK